MVAAHNNTTITMTPVEEIVKIGEPVNFTCRYDLQNNTFTTLLWYFNHANVNHTNVNHTNGNHTKVFILVSTLFREVAENRYRGNANFSSKGSIVGITLTRVKMRDEGENKCRVYTRPIISKYQFKLIIYISTLPVVGLLPLYNDYTHCYDRYCNTNRYCNSDRYCNNYYNSGYTAIISRNRYCNNYYK